MVCVTLSTLGLSADPQEAGSFTIGKRAKARTEKRRSGIGKYRTISGIRAKKGISMKHLKRVKQGRLLTVLVLILVWSIGPFTPAASGKGADRVVSGSTSGSTRLTAGGPRGSGVTKDGAHAANGMDQGSQIYFAEGYTGQGPDLDFSEHLSILNTNPVTVTGQIDYFLAGDITATTPITVAIAVPAHAQLVEDVGQDVGVNQTVSAVVQTDQVVTATRTISRTTTAGAVLGESVSNGEDGLAQFWYFAEGYTGSSFQEYLALFNPGAIPATVTVEPVGGAGGQVPAPLTSTVPAHGRTTLNLRAAIPGRSIGLSVQSDQPVATERILYWGAGSGSGKFGTSVNGGIRGPATLWTFPFVSTVGSDQAFLSFVDPTTVEAHVQLTAYSTAGIEEMPQTVAVAAGARATVALPADTVVTAMTASSDVPVIAEEGQYFGGSPNVGDHMGSIVAGVPQAAGQWIFSGLSAPVLTNQSWYILNRGSTSASISVTLYGQGVPPVQTHIRADPGKLTVVNPATLHMVHGISGSAWLSSSPVVIAQMIRIGDPSAEAIVAGVAQTP
jgi:hypothetical protein